MKEIVKIPHPALRKVSDEIKSEELESKEIKDLLKDLSLSLRTRDDGVGLSAPQIGTNKRVFVVAGKVFDKDWLENREIDKNKEFIDKFFINPKVIKKSKKLAVAEEGCLSIPETYGDVTRPANVTIEYLDIEGNKKTRGAGGLLARIFQHEIDHLDGILFTDKAENIRKAQDTHENQEL